MTFKEETAASALLFKDKDGDKALRVEVPDLGLEFKDNAYIGTDPAGILYYNSRDDFQSSANYKVTKVTKDKKTYVNIIFWGSTSTEDKAYAKFVADDDDGVVTATSMENYSATGNWVDLDMAIANATVYKVSTENKITLTTPSVNKTATFYDNKYMDAQGKDGTGNALDNTSVSVKGNLYFKKLSELSDGKYAKYNNDNIVFYSSDLYAKDFTAFFIPYEHSKSLGIATDKTKVFKEVSWS